MGICSVLGWLTGGASNASTTARAVSLLMLVACTLLAQVLYVVQFTCWTNNDYSDAVQALQPAVMPLRVARAYTLLLHRGWRLRRAQTVYV